MRIEHEESQFDMAILSGPTARDAVTGDKVIDEAGQDLQVEIVAEALAGQIMLDIRHPDAAEDEPLQVDGVEVQALPFFYALNNRFKGTG